MSEKFSKNAMVKIFILLIILNVILRFQVVPHEIYPDSVFIHVMTNSLNKFGYAKWILHPLSIFGLYPGSYTSSVQFFLSGISQSANMEMESVIFLYCILISVVSIFTSYIMAKKIINNNIFKFLVAFLFSTSPGVLGYTTWTIPSRGLFIVLAPLFVYTMLRCRKSLKYAPLVVILSILLFSTHHLFYFLIPTIFAFLFLNIFYKIKYIKSVKVDKLFPAISIGCFLLAFSIPFFTGKFLESSRYAPIDVSYGRYIGIPIVFVIGGLVYLILKHNKKFEEWFLLLSVAYITTFIYIQTYMKWFIPIFAIPLAALGLVNIIRLSVNKKLILKVFTIFLLISLSFSAYYQYIHFIPKPEEKPINERYLEESTYQAALWMRENLNGSAISHVRYFDIRIFAISEKANVLVGSLVINHIYGFNELNISEFKMYPLTSDGFWFAGYTGPAVGEITWDYINLEKLPYQKFAIKYFVENTRARGNVIWHHGVYPSNLLRNAYDEKACLYDNGEVHIWGL